MRRSLLTATAFVVALALAGGGPAPVVADQIGIVDAWVPDGDPADGALHGSYTGFGAAATGGEGRPLFTVTSLADHGIGSLRSVLETIAAVGGGRVEFAVGGDVVLLAELRVPAHTTIDGLTAPAPGITLWGDRLSPSGGVLEIGADDVVVRGLRIRNAVNDGIQIAPKRGVSIARIVVDHCSITNSGDGGVDVTGADGALVTDVTLSWSYLAANGGPCAKVWCGGGSLVKYGVTRFSAHANVWDKNLRRNPSVDGGAVTDGSLADLRANVVQGYVESGMQVRDGARANVVGNFFAGDRPLLTAGAAVFAAANEGAAAPSLAAPFDVTEPLPPLDEAVVLANAGAPGLDAIDAAYRGLATYEDAKNAVMAPADTTLADLPPLLAATTLATARRTLRLARRLRTSADHEEAVAAYEDVVALLGTPTGMYARSAEAVVATALLGLTDLDRDVDAARALLAAAREHARLSGDAALERRIARRLMRSR